MSRTDKDNKHQPKHEKSFKCVEKDCNYCNAKAKENRASRDKKAFEIEQ